MLFEQIAKNKRKTIELFVGFFLFMGIVGAALGYYMLGEWVPGVIIAVVTGIVYAVYMFGQSTDVVMGMNHAQEITRDRKSTRLNSSHVSISYAVFCSKIKNYT